MPNLICCLICLLAIGSLAMDGPNSKRIAAGRTHFLLINKENEVTSFGYGDRGELGHGNIFHILDKEAPLKPIEIFKGKKPVAVEAGWGCSFVLLENGHIYSFGDNSRAQLGRNVGPLLHPGELEGLQNERLVEIAVGDHFGAALNDAGKVFVWGQYSQGQPSELACLKGRAIRKLAAGERLLVIDSDGDLWSVSEVLGTKELSCHRINEQDPLSEKIEQVAAGFSHVVILTKGGRVFSYGNNKHGQLGHGDYEQSMRPKEIMGLIDKKIVRVVAGDSFSAALCANGEVWWFGQLRIERNSVYSAILPHPTLLEGVPSNITDIAANFSSGTLFLVSNGTMLIVGDPMEPANWPKPELTDLYPKRIKGLRPGYWTKDNHLLQGRQVRDAVFTMLILNTGHFKPNLPADVLFIIFGFLR